MTIDRLVRALGARIHPPEPSDAEDAATAASDFACSTIAMFQRAVEPLDTIHPGLARLLAANVERDAALNEELTELADIAAAWRVQTQGLNGVADALQDDLDDALARAFDVEEAARAVRQALARATETYAALCLTVQSGAGMPQSASGRVGEPARDAMSVDAGRPNGNGVSARFRFRRAG